MVALLVIPAFRSPRQRDRHEFEARVPSQPELLSKIVSKTK